MPATFRQMMNEVVQYGSCCECGSCVLVCPHNVIDYIAGKPKQVAKASAAFDFCGMSEGIGCDVCAQVCPRLGEREHHLTEQVFGDLDQMYRGVFGAYRRVVAARCVDPVIRARAEDGGVVTGLLAWLRRNDEIVAKMRVVRAAREVTIERSDERVFLPGRANPVVLRRNANALFLLQRLRDEAHRFAITYHRALRGKERLRSALDAIPGVGAERRRRLLRAFGSVKRMRAASLEELGAVPGISAPLAVAVRAALDRLAVPKDVDTRRGRLVAVAVEADEGEEQSQTRAGDAADDADGEAGRDVDSPEPGDYA